ncbi:cellulose-binding domain-containing protein [Actinoplanes sp. CA-051413]|uniref:cellulose-binding domain-containing protein n=1 Tax=Actinoplanes sp. CA-051413 TaxID=3239899 RepID=UPI003D9871CA
MTTQDCQACLYVADKSAAHSPLNTNDQNLAGKQVATANAAAGGCRVDYTIASHWDGGCTSDVKITNLGDPVSGWRLTFAFAGGERVGNAWNATLTQAGSQVTAVNVGYNGNIGTAAVASFGYQGTVSGTHAKPTGFALNGVACTGAATTSPPTVPPSNPAPSSPAPTTPPPSTPAPTTPPASGWDPPATLSAALDQVWQHQEQTYNKWMDVMAGHNGWPYTQVPVKVVGWAVRDRAQLEWTDNSVDIYVDNIRENAPQCPEPCGRFFNQSGTYPNCPGGAARHYDQSLWLTAGFSGGAGGRRLPDEGRQRHPDHRLRRVDAARLVAAPEDPLRLFADDQFRARTNCADALIERLPGQ